MRLSKYSPHVHLFLVSFCLFSHLAFCVFVVILISLQIYIHFLEKYLPENKDNITNTFNFSSYIVWIQSEMLFTCIYILISFYLVSKTVVYFLPTSLIDFSTSVKIKIRFLIYKVTSPSPSCACVIKLV